MHLLFLLKLFFDEKLAFILVLYQYQ